MALPTVNSAALSGDQSNRAKVGQWAAAYAKNPSDPKMVLGYAYALKATGNKQQALTVLNSGFQANSGNGEIAAQLGRVALELGRTDIAQKSLAVAQQKGVTDWRTLSAQGTLLAKKGDHANAQRYFQAALKQKPDSTSVINNLALSYALDGKAKESETLLRQAVASGSTDKRVRQNLALVLGLQGKYNEATQVARWGRARRRRTRTSPICAIC
ncbi:tetratricopeptide repeat protein [Methyloligella halotolerans]|nr:tetratricopeptide repeat protein [Methyloligella halotolerans]